MFHAYARTVVLLLDETTYVRYKQQRLGSEYDEDELFSCVAIEFGFVIYKCT